MQVCAPNRAAGEDISPAASYGSLELPSGAIQQYLLFVWSHAGIIPQEPCHLIHCGCITVCSSLTSVQAVSCSGLSSLLRHGWLLLSQQPLDPSLKCRLCLLCGKQSFQPPQICIHRYVLIRHIDEPLNRCADDSHLRVEREIHSAPHPLPRLIHDLYRNSSEAFK